MVHTAICIGDKLRRMKKYSEDNGAVCVKGKFDLELCDNSYNR